MAPRRELLESTGKHLNVATSQTSMFWGFAEKQKNIPPVVFNGESKTGLGFETGPRQQKLCHDPT